MLDHDTDSYYKISRAFVDGEPVGNLTRDNIVDNITLYWLTGTGASAARWYWEFGRFLAAAGAAGQAPPPVSVPVGFTTFPGEIWAAPRSWVETVYPGLAYFNEVDRGGHFAAWEEPELFATEVRAAFRSLRSNEAVTAVTRREGGASRTRRPSRMPGRRRRSHEHDSNHRGLCLIVGSSLALRWRGAAVGNQAHRPRSAHDLSVAGREVVQVRVDFAPGRRSAGTRIRARRSPMSSKERWSISSRASGR